MDITPLDIRKQEFKKSFNGYDKHEVESFLEMIAEQMETLIKENMTYQQQLNETEHKVEYYMRMEKTLQDTLTSAQKTTDDLRKNAQRESDIIKKNAEIEATHILETARRDVNNLKAEIKSLIIMKNNFIAKFRGLIDAYIKLLEQETLEHKFDVNEFNQVLKERPENIQNIGDLFNSNKKNNENNNKISGLSKE